MHSPPCNLFTRRSIQRNKTEHIDLVRSLYCSKNTVGGSSKQLEKKVIDQVGFIS